MRLENPKERESDEDAAADLNEGGKLRLADGSVTVGIRFLQQLLELGQRLVGVRRAGHVHEEGSLEGSRCGALEAHASPGDHDAPLGIERPPGSAAVPLWTAIAYFALRYSANFFSNALVCSPPADNHPLSNTSIAYFFSNADILGMFNGYFISKV